MKEVIDILLQKKATLEADKEAEKALALEKIDAEYAERSNKIDALLDMAGYVAPVEVPAYVDTVEQEPAIAEPVVEANTQQIY